MNQELIDSEIEDVYNAALNDYINDIFTLDELFFVLKDLEEAEEYLACAGVKKAIDEISK